VATPVLAAGDLLLLAHQDGTVRAINRFTREEAWALSLDSPPVAPLSYANGTVYAHTQDGKLHAIR
jgi:outer membrane protein assembly factor BamB